MPFADASKLNAIAGIIDVPIDSLRDLTRDQRLYLIETLIEVEHPRLGAMVPLRPNTMQGQILKTLSPYEITVKWRRAGLTSIYVACAWINIITRPGWNVELFAHDWDTAKAIFEQVIERQFHSLPDQIKPKPTAYGAGFIKFEDIGSSFTVGTAGQSESVAMKKGQARKINELICTEYAFYAHPELFIQKIENCVPEDTGIIRIDSTPSGLNSFYERFNGARLGKGRFMARFFPWWWSEVCMLALSGDESIEDILGEGPITKAEMAIGDGNPHATLARGDNQLTPEQIKWRRWKIRDTKPLGALTPEDRFRVEYPEDPDSCFLRSGRPVFSTNDCVITCKIRDAIPGNRHAIGHDASTGDGSGHPCGISIIDLTAGEQVYEERAWLTIEAQAARLKLLQERYPGLIIPERNGPGLAVITTLKALKVRKVYRHRNPVTKDGPKKLSHRKLGFPMTSLTKPMVFEELAMAISRYGGKDPELRLGGPITTDELKRFQYDDRDLINFPEQRDSSGELTHGDVAMATAIAWQARKRVRSGVG